MVALPLALAFGVASGAGALAGLYGAIFCGFFAALFGGTPAQVSGPTGPMTVVMALIITHFAQNPAIAFSVVVLGGAFQILFGVLKFGRYINLVPIPVVSGFMSGIGCIIIILQIGPLFGHPAPAGVMLSKLAAIPDMLKHINADTALLSGITLAIVYLTPERISRFVPPALIALVAGMGISALWLNDVSYIGEIPTGLPTLQSLDFSIHELPFIIRYALVLAFLGAIDTLLTSLIADSITRTFHKPDRELVGQGIGNMVSGFFGGLPGAGATMRTVVNVRNGGRTPISGALHSLVILVIVLGFGGLVERIPNAVLAAILFKVGADIIDWRYIKRIPKSPSGGVVVMLTTLALTIFVDLITAVAVGTVMAAVKFVKRMADTQLQSMKLISAPGQVADLTEEEEDILEHGAGRIVLFHAEGPLSFGSAKGVSRLITSNKEQDVLIIDLTDVPFIDSSASITLEEVIQDAIADQDEVLLCGLRPSVKDTLDKIEISSMIPRDHMLSTRLDAMRKADQLLLRLSPIPDKNEADR